MRVANKLNSCGDERKPRPTGNLHDQVVRSTKSNKTEKKERKGKKNLVPLTRNYFQKGVGLMSKCVVFFLKAGNVEFGIICVKKKCPN